MPSNAYLLAYQWCVVDHVLHHRVLSNLEILQIPIFRQFVLSEESFAEDDCQILEIGGYQLDKSISSLVVKIGSHLCVHLVLCRMSCNSRQMLHDDLQGRLVNRWHSRQPRTDRGKVAAYVRFYM